MKIKDMFYDDINREINGVIKVDQSTTDIIKQEVDEYVITRELKKHFITFFNYYADAFNKPTTDIGVWISGFFGSGKSHFLKILSYILENRIIDGMTTVERFRNKFDDDPATFMLIDQCTKIPAETILFNIDVEGPMNKDKTAVLQVFAKMFYNHLGFYGHNFKVAKLEQFIDKKGKTDEFRRVFEEKNGESWVNSRDTFDFCEDEVVETLMEVLDMSEVSARNWFDNDETINISIASLVNEIKEYVSNKPEDYRLLFMIDEVGQYVGGDTDMLLNLQSLVEKIGSECDGKVWVMCTGQEAIDEIIRTRNDEFSRIQARFKTRLSLSSSSADEVIQKRILRKKYEAKEFLDNIYSEKRNELANLFKFKDAVNDIKGYETADEFSKNFPFVPYQFILMQKVFSEIRKHGNAGKHLSGGERSMLSGFQEAAQKLQNDNENTIVPFYLFYDTVHTFLDGSIRRVIERCERAIADNKGLNQGDENVLKLLYMIRYVDDIPANLDNIIILMADDITVDKIDIKKNIQLSLERLIRQNYIARTGDIYNFLTDAEQDVEREIRNEYIEPSEVTKAISDILFGKIYPNKKFRYEKKYDFSFNKRVDDLYHGNSSLDTMEIQILTTATPTIDKSEMRLVTQSSGKVICVLEDTEYYEYLENAMKIKKFARKKNISQLTKAMQDIIRNKQDNAEQYLEDAETQLIEAFENAEFYIDGERVSITSGTAKEKIDQALHNLVSNTYLELTAINDNAESDQDILDLLNGKKDMGVLEGFESNRRAADEINQFLLSRQQRNIPVTMEDIHKKFQKIPYGWKEIDIAYVIARLIYEQKVTIKYNGETIRTDDLRLPDFLRKKTLRGKTRIQKREVIANKDLKESSKFMRDFFDSMDVPQDDDGLSSYVINKFNELKEHYRQILLKYEGKNYPDKSIVIHAEELIDVLLSAQNDNIALIKKLIDMEDDFYDMQEDMGKIEDFFSSQVSIFDTAVQLLDSIQKDQDYFGENDILNKALNKIRLIVLSNPKKANYDYNDIPKLNTLMKEVQDQHAALLTLKQENLHEIIRQCMGAIHCTVQDNFDSQITKFIKESDEFYQERKQAVDTASSLMVLESYIPNLWRKKDETVNKIQKIQESIESAKNSVNEQSMENNDDSHNIEKAKCIKSYPRQILFPSKTLESELDIDEYVQEIQKTLKMLLKDSDGINID